MHLPASTRRVALTLLVALSTAHCAAGTEALSGHAAPSPSPHDLVGLDLNLQVEKAEGPAAASYPNQGAIVRRILPRGQWTSHGAGGLNHRDSQGSSQWRQGGERTLIETATDTSGPSLLSTFSYRFDTPRHGHWVWRINQGQATLSGSFTTSPSAPTAEQQLAPATNAGLHVPLIIKNAVSPAFPAGSYPAAGLVLQTYASDGTLSLRGFGPGTLDSTGTYTYKRLSANMAVEETVQTSALFKLPYTMVYTFRTANSGTWYQNFGNGLIYFSGTFDTFPK